MSGPTKFHTPPAVRAEPEDAPENTLGIRRIMFAVEDSEDVLARLHTYGAVHPKSHQGPVSSKIRG